MDEPKTRKNTRFQRLLQAPLFHFLLLGSLLFFADRIWSTPTPQVIIEVATPEIQALEKGWLDQNGRSPDPELLEALIRSHIEDELLLHETRRLGWHRTDGIVLRRLIRNQRFLAEDESGSDEEMLERAYEQGMDRSDIVVRRRLLERMRLLVVSSVRDQEIPDEELEAYLAAHHEEFMEPARIRLSHIFLSRDRHGEDLLADAKALGQKLREQDIAPATAAEWGDPFLLPLHLPLSSQKSLARQLGPDFAAASMQASPGRWEGPISSSYGLHYVWIYEYVPASLPPLARIRSRVRNERLRELEKAAFRNFVASLRAQARIEVELPKSAAGS
jgi:hypothetical protein